jgi:carboxyl-terminal processing protease
MKQSLFASTMKQALFASVMKQSLSASATKQALSASAAKQPLFASSLSTLLSFLVLIMAFISGPAFAFVDENTNPDSAISTTDNIKKNSLQKSDIDRFTNAIAEIKDYYVSPINDKKLLEDAIRGMLTGLDPHSEYLDEDSYKTLLMTTSGAFGGLGVEVTGELGVLKVISPIDDTPAAKAGIKPGDYIVSINGKLVNDMTLDEAVTSMRGQKGSVVVLTIIRKGEKLPLNFKLTRDIIKISSVKSNMLSNGFGYVRISEFQQPTTELMIAAIDKLKKEAGGNLKGLVLDLRNNPGGLLETAVQVSDVFLDNKSLQSHPSFKNVVVYAEGRLPSSKYNAKAMPGDILHGAPMVVLVNAGSASASEIVAGALQDYRRAVIVGTNSFGKGSVQTVLPLDDTHAIKLTTALYHTPSGRTIQNKGIVPDVIIDDLKIQPNTNAIDTSLLNPIHEFDLKGHITNKKDDNKNMDMLKTDQDDKNNTLQLAQTDFQLYAALKILKTMYMVEINDPLPIGKSNAIPVTSINNILSN